MISVAMATYNGQKYIKEQLDSIISQSLKADEIVISDDGSTDDTIAILDDYASRYSFIRVTHNVGRHGFVANFANAISLCGGDYIALCDQDDIWCEDHIKDLYDNIGDKDFVGADAELVNVDGSSQHITMKDVLGIHSVPHDNDSIFLHELITNIFQGSSCMLTRTLYDKYKDIPDGVKYHDHYFALMACMEGGCTYIDKVITKYRQHESSVTENIAVQGIQKLKNAVAPDESFVSKYTKLRDEDLDFLHAVEPYIKDEYILQYHEAITYLQNIQNNQMKKNRRFFVKYYEEVYLEKKVLSRYLFRYIKHFWFNK